METTPANKDEQGEILAAPEVAAPAFDLDAFDIVSPANEGVTVEMKTVDGKPTGLFLRLLGRDSDAFREIQFKHQTRRMNNMGENDGKFVFDAEQADEDALDLLSACVTSWSMGDKPWTGHVMRGGKKVNCTKAEVIALFKKYPPFREQADVFIGNRANFLKG